MQLRLGQQVLIDHRVERLRLLHVDQVRGAVDDLQSRPRHQRCDLLGQTRRGHLIKLGRDEPGVGDCEQHKRHQRQGRGQ